MSKFGVATLHHWRATAHPIFKIRISRNTKCDNLVDFPKSGHIFVSAHNTFLKQLKYLIN